MSDPNKPNFKNRQDENSHQWEEIISSQNPKAEEKEKKSLFREKTKSGLRSDKFKITWQWNNRKYEQTIEGLDETLKFYERIVITEQTDEKQARKDRLRLLRILVNPDSGADTDDTAQAATRSDISHWKNLKNTA